MSLSQDPVDEEAVVLRWELHISYYTMGDYFKTWTGCKCKIFFPLESFI